MKAQYKWHRLIARLLIATTTSLQLPYESHAATITTEASVLSERDRVLILLEKPDLRAQLEAYGVQPADAKARVAAMTDAEVAQLAAGIEDAPAGGFFQVIAQGLVAAGYVIVITGSLVIAGIVALVRAASR